MFWQTDPSPDAAGISGCSFSQPWGRTNLALHGDSSVPRCGSDASFRGRPPVDRAHILPKLTLQSSIGPMFDMERHALRSAVVIAVGPDLAPSLRWTASSIPTVANVDDALGTIVRSKCADWRAILRDSSASSAFQDAHGNWEATFLSLAEGVGPSIEAMSLAFETHIWPLGSVKATRTKA